MCIVHVDHFILCGPETHKWIVWQNSEDPEEMQHNATFHQGLHCLLGENGSSEKDIQLCLQYITFDPSIDTMNHPDFVKCSFMEYSNGLKRVKYTSIFSSLLMDCFYDIADFINAYSCALPVSSQNFIGFSDYRRVT